MTKKRIIILLYRLLNIKRCKKKTSLKPMGIRSTVYPDGYKPPIKRVYSDGTVEYVIPIDNQKQIDKAWEKLGKEVIAGKSIKAKTISSDPGDEVEHVEN